MISAPDSVAHPRDRRALKVFRAASLVLAPGLAWYAALPPQGLFGVLHPEWSQSRAHAESLHALMTYVLGPAWLALALGVGLRAVTGALAKDRAEEVTALDRLQILTANGSATLWASAIALWVAAANGWASLAVLGVAGLGLVGLAVASTLVFAGGDDPMRQASLRRSFEPRAAREGDLVVEELHFDGARIPAGYRLFAASRVGPRWPVTRYALDGSASDGEVVLESELGPAHRGRFEAPLVELWLGDVLGLTESVRRRGGPASISVTPRPREIEDALGLIGKGGRHEPPETIVKLPSEGSLRLREYQPGDDARRIHWLRSLASRDIVVRLPDERPQDRPRLRLVLDTYLPNLDAMSCDANHELLDGMVKVWLGLAQALTKSGAEVTFATALQRGETVSESQLALRGRSLSRAEQLGVEVAWQVEMPTIELLQPGVRTLVVSHRADPGGAVPEDVAWILVPRNLWTQFDEPIFTPSYATLPHPMGSPDNRFLRRRRERRRVDRAQRSKLELAEACGMPRAMENGYLARPIAHDRVRLEALS